MEQRKKLIELLLNNPKASGKCSIAKCGTDCKYYESDKCYTEMLADHLIANGVVVLPCMCKDCEYGYLWTNDGTGARGKCAFMVGDNQYVAAEGFCNLGERKGGDE